MPYELMKLRLINAVHQAPGYPGYLTGYRYVHEAAADPVFADFLLGYMQLEARPTILAVPGIDLDDYISTLLHRFANPAIRDTLDRLCAVSSDRIPKWLLPVIRRNLATGGPIGRRRRQLGAVRGGRRRSRPAHRGRGRAPRRADEPGAAAAHPATQLH